MKKSIILNSPKYGNRELVFDEEDMNLICRVTWSVHKLGEKFYCTGRDKTTRKMIFIHRLITGAAKGQLVDHADGNTFNNTRQNLRICTGAQNAANCKKKVNNTTGFKGVSWDRRIRRYFAQIKHNYKNIRLGSFDKKEDAARAYDAAAVKLFGEFAKINTYN